MVGEYNLARSAEGEFAAIILRPSAQISLQQIRETEALAHEVNASVCHIRAVPARRSMKRWTKSAVAAAIAMSIRGAKFSKNLM